MDIETGTVLVRIKDKRPALVVEHEGGSHDWYTVAIAAGRTVTLSSSGIGRKYHRLPSLTQRIASALIAAGGLQADTVQVAEAIASGDQSVIEGLDESATIHVREAIEGYAS